MNTIQEALAGGAQAVGKLMRERLSRLTTVQQDAALWAECRAHLVARDMLDTVEEIEASREGRLDTMPREDLMSAIGFTLGGRDWPCNAEPNETSKKFFDTLRSTLDSRGYAVAGKGVQ